MSEHLPQQQEMHNSKEDKNPYGETPKIIREAIPNERELERQKHEQIEKLIEKIEHEAKSGIEMRPQEPSGPQTGKHTAYGSKAHSTASQTLRRAQKELSTAELQFSKIIHNPKVEAASDAAGATIGRPSGLLVGGIFSLIASIGVLMACNYFGYEYNFTIGLLAFAAGFIFGLLSESIYRLFKHKPYR